MSDRKIGDAIRALSKHSIGDTVSLLFVNVSVVNIGARTFDGVAIGGDGVTDILGVQLMAGVSDGLLMVPNVGSIVVVAYSTRVAPIALLYSDVSQLSIYASTSVSIAGPQVQLNDGSFGGMVTVAGLLAKINAIENKLNQVLVINKLPPITPITLRSDLENTAVTHGI